MVDGCWIVGHLMGYGFCVWWWWAILVMAMLFVASDNGGSGNG